MLNDATKTVAAVPQLWTARQVAAALAIAERTVWRLAADAERGQGIFPRPLRIGPKTVRWRLADVEGYLAALAGEGIPAVAAASVGGNSEEGT